MIEKEYSCKRWIQFLNETIQTPEVIDQVQEFFGYCLTPDTSFEKCMLCVGSGANGKSTMLKVLHYLVGRENCSSVNIEDLDCEFDRAALYGKLVNISDGCDLEAIESKYFKEIVSGDSIIAAFKHKNSFEFDPTCKLVIVTNQIHPVVSDNGFYRRILPIQFKNQFIAGEDEGLMATLKGEIHGILHWALAGLQRLWKQKEFTKCEESDRILLSMAGKRRKEKK